MSGISFDSISLGNTVLCDLCNEEWTDNMEGTGGFLFGSKAVCPHCAPAFRARAIECGEEDHIRSEQPGGKSFWRWVVEDLRGGRPGRINIWSIS